MLQFSHQGLFSFFTNAEESLLDFLEKMVYSLCCFERAGLEVSRREIMKKLTGAWLFAMLFALWFFEPSLWAAEIPDPTFCDSESKEVRQGRPGGAEGKVVDGLGPMTKMKHVQEAWSSAAKASGKIPPPDKRHLCLALNPIKNPENRFKHKDHSTYYCTLILNRDIQAYCYAVVEKNSKKCDLIVGKELEKECLKKSDKNYIAEETKMQAKAPAKKTPTEKSGDGKKKVEKTAKKKDASDAQMKELKAKMVQMERQRKKLLEEIDTIKRKAKGQ